MKFHEGVLTFSPSDLHHFLECRHLTALLASSAREGRERPRQNDAGVERLLEAPCRRVDQMTLLNMFCRLIEVAKTG